MKLINFFTRQLQPDINTKAAAVYLHFCLLLLALCLVPAFYAGAQETIRRPRAVKPVPAGEVVVILQEQTFRALFEAVFALEKPLTYPLRRGRGNDAAGPASQRGSGCASEIVLLRAAEGVATAVHFRDGQIDAPLAFSGSYDAPLVGCLSFQGWADATLNLSFDRERQALVANVLVRDVKLKNVPSLFGDGVTRLVQDAIDARVNPVEILRAEQLSTRLPLAKTGNPATLRLRAREVRHEIAPGELRLRIAYEFVRDE